MIPFVAPEPWTARRACTPADLPLFYPTGTTSRRVGEAATAEVGGVTERPGWVGLEWVWLAAVGAATWVLVVVVAVGVFGWR